MPDPLLRGAVVVRDRRYSVVWDVRAGALVLLPIIVPQRFYKHDVALELADLVACAVPIAGAVIRPKRNAPVAAEGHDPVGRVPPATMCRVVLGVIRGWDEARVEATWAADRRHRRETEDDRCVNLTS